jgi:hypothetical protein
MGSIATYMPTALRGIANRAKREPDAKFGGLAGLLTADNLRLCFDELRKSAAPGVDILLRRLSRKLAGYWNYYGVSGNFLNLQKFWREVQRILYKWLNRRSQRRSYTWKQLFRLLKRHGVPSPRIVDDRQMKMWFSV